MANQKLQNDAEDTAQILQELEHGNTPDIPNPEEQIKSETQRKTVAHDLPSGLYDDGKRLGENPEGFQVRGEIAGSLDESPMMKELVKEREYEALDVEGSIMEKQEEEYLEERTQQEQQQEDIVMTEEATEAAEQLEEAEVAEEATAETAIQEEENEEGEEELF